MSNLGPQKINLSYDGLLQVPGGLTASLQTITDGNGNSSGLQLSTSGFSGQITSDSVNITGGTINGTTIGASAAAAGSFTTLNVSGTTTLGSPLSGILKGSAGIVGLATAGSDYVSPSVLGAANGVATLGSDSKLTASQVPAIAITEYLGTVNSQAAMLALTGQEGDWCIRSDLGTTWVITGSNPALIGSWTQLSYPTAPVTSVNSFTGAVSLAYGDVGAAPATTGSSILYANGSGGFSNVTVGSGLTFVGGTLAAASASGTVTSVSIVSANGLAGTVANPSTTPGITLTTTVSGVLKGNGTAISAAVSGTDYAPATSGTSILKGDNAGGFAAAIANTDYQGVITATGLLKGAGAGSISAAVVGTDYAPATTGTSILKANGFGGFANAVSGTDYAPATSGTSLLKGNGSGGFSNATSGTDYAPATSGTSILYGNGFGGFSNVTVGSGLTFTGGTLASVSGGGGTVTDMSVVTANGFAGTVATSTTTPAVTLTTTVTGMLKGNGTAISAATAGSDYPGLASNNTFTGNQIISVNSASDALRITQTGSGNALLVEDAANPDSTPFVVDSIGSVISGATTSVTTTAGTSRIQALNAIAPYLATNNTVDATGPIFTFGKNRNAAIVATDDILGSTRYEGFDGTSYVRGAQIFAQVDGTPGTNDMPGRLVFSTTKDGASIPTEAMRIDSGQRVGIGATAGGDTSVLSAKAITGSTTAFGIRQLGSIQSDVTTQANGIQSNIGTAAAAFTLASLRQFLASQGTIGATSAVTNQYGFYADSGLTGATNNYGFYSGIASGTGRYNFYAAGTADNYFAGKVGIGGAPEANSVLTVFGSMPSGPTTGSAQIIETTVTSGYTGIVNYLRTYANTQAAAFTVSDIRHCYASQGVFGAGSTVTNQAGFFAESSLTGATNNYGFYSNIASGTGRWNFYAAGTAANYFAGATTIAGTATLGTLSGLLKGTSGVVSAAVSGTDYAPATSGSSILYGNGSGGFNNVTVGAGLSFSAGTLSSTSTLTLETEKATTSGTSVGFTGIPSTVKRITFTLSGVATSGNSYIQIGSGSYVTTGYVSTWSGSSSSGTDTTTGFFIAAGGVTNNSVIVLTLQSASTNTWIASGNIRWASSANMVVGSLSLSGALDRIQITGGTFSAGSVNILYES